MKTFLTLLVTTLLFSLSVKAQDHVGGYFGIGLGAAIPLADAAEKDITKDPSYLKPGPTFGVYGGYFFNKSFGLTATLNVQANSDDIEAIQNELNEIIRTNTGITSYNVIYDSDGWGVLNAMLGPTALFGNDKWVIEPFVVAGLFMVTTPDLFPELQVPGTMPDAGEIEVQTLPGFGYQFGSNFRYNFGYQFALHMRVAYSAGSAKGENMHSKMYLADIWSNTISVNQETNEFMKSGYKYAFESLQATVGIAMLLERKGNRSTKTTTSSLFPL